MKKLAVIILFCATLVPIISCATGKPVVDTASTRIPGDKEMMLGVKWYQKGCYRRSLEYFFKAYELYSSIDALEGVAKCLNNIGITYRAMGNYDRALLFLDEAYSQYVDINDMKGTLMALSNKAGVLIDKGELDSADRVLNQAMGIKSKLHENTLYIPLLNNKGVLLTKRKEFHKAEEILRICIREADRSDNLLMASVNFAMGNLMFESKRFNEALGFFNNALYYDRKASFFKGIAEDLFFLGMTCVKLNNDSEAIKFWKRCIKIYALIGNPKRVYETMRLLKGLAKENKINIEVIEIFVERWEEGRLFENLCGD
nr:tetratricopeptide repeat protein [Desulfobacterales bacterium]